MVLTRNLRRYGDPNDKFDRLATAALLLGAGADPNLKSAGKLPLGLVSDEDLMLTRLLLDRGGRSEVAPLYGGGTLGPITVAIGSQRFVLAGELIRRLPGRLDATEVHALRAAVEQGRRDLARQLLARGGNCNARGP